MFLFGYIERFVNKFQPKSFKMDFKTIYNAIKFKKIVLFSDNITLNVQKNVIF